MTIEMSSPVTRAELREELASLEQRFDKKLDLWGGALLHRMNAEISTLRAEMSTMGSALRREIQGAFEDFHQAIRNLNEPYQDLPGRVTKLEAKVFPPKRTRRRS